jgi:hypothetical protein
VKTVVVEVSGGVVQQVYSDTKAIRVIKIDWDAGESPGDECSGGDLFVQRMSMLPPETRGALAVIEQGL